MYRNIYYSFIFFTFFLFLFVSNVSAASYEGSITYCTNYAWGSPACPFVRADSTPAGGNCYNYELVQNCPDATGGIIQCVYRDNSCNTKQKLCNSPTPGDGYTCATYCNALSYGSNNDNCWADDQLRVNDERPRCSDYYTECINDGCVPEVGPSGVPYTCPGGSTCSPQHVCVAQPPSVTLSSSVTNVNSNTDFTLSWSTGGNPSTCLASGGRPEFPWQGTKSTSGGSESKRITAPNDNVLYTLTCSNPSGLSASSSVTVTSNSCGTCNANVTCSCTGQTGGTDSCGACGPVSVPICGSCNPASPPPTTGGSCSISVSTNPGALTAAGTISANQNGVGYDRVRWRINSTELGTNILGQTANASGLSLGVDYYFHASMYKDGDSTVAAVDCTSGVFNLGDAPTASTPPTNLKCMHCQRISSPLVDQYRWNSNENCTGAGFSSDCQLSGSLCTGGTSGNKYPAVEGNDCYTSSTSGSYTAGPSLTVGASLIRDITTGVETIAPPGPGGIFPYYHWPYQQAARPCILSGFYNGTEWCFQEDYYCYGTSVCGGRYLTFAANGEVPSSTSSSRAGIIEDPYSLIYWPENYQPVSYYTYQHVAWDSSQTCDYCNYDCAPENCPGDGGCTGGYCGNWSTTNSNFRCVADSVPNGPYTIPGTPVIGSYNTINEANKLCYPQNGDAARIDVVYQRVLKPPLAFTMYNPSPACQSEGIARVLLNWSGSERATSYGIYRGGTLIDTVNAPQQSYVDNGASALNTSYSYYIKAINGDGCLNSDSSDCTSTAPKSAATSYCDTIPPAVSMVNINGVDLCIIPDAIKATTILPTNPRLWSKFNPVQISVNDPSPSSGIARVELILRNDQTPGITPYNVINEVYTQTAVGPSGNYEFNISSVDFEPSSDPAQSVYPNNQFVLTAQAFDNANNRGATSTNFVTDTSCKCANIRTSGGDVHANIGIQYSCSDN